MRINTLFSTVLFILSKDRILPKRVAARTFVFSRRTSLASILQGGSIAISAEPEEYDSATYHELHQQSHSIVSDHHN